tara:strand:+ start:21893 stop:22570 length:678 start_codon:yes stop_codon:yes gene_type:complete
MITFKHSGDLGDIIYSLPTVRLLSQDAHMLLDTTTDTKLTEASVGSISGLLLEQEYVSKVSIYKGEEVDYDLDKFRSVPQGGRNLVDLHLDAFNLSQNSDNLKPWLKAKYYLPPLKKVVISRSCRYQSNHIFWEQLCKTINLDEAVFIGHPLEHKVFEMAFGVKVDYHTTATLSDAAEAINAAETVYCNQSCIHAIAQGLNQSITLELFRLWPNTTFHGSKVVNV